MPTLDDLARWHADPDVVPFAARWRPASSATARSGRTARRTRRSSPGSSSRLHRAARATVDALTRALADEAHRRGFAEVWLRVVPENAAARRAYEAAGFARATPSRRRRSTPASVELRLDAGLDRVAMPQRLGPRIGTTNRPLTRSEPAMKLFLDTADIEEIRTVDSWGVLDGVTTNPTLFAKTKGMTYDEVLKQICEITPGRSPRRSWPTRSTACSRRAATSRSSPTTSSSRSRCPRTASRR